jgi:transcriptional regulator with XRE-family HTH domain
VTTTIGNNLRRLRKQSGLSQAALSEHAGVPQPTISNIESGRREPHQATLRKLAAALGVEVPALLVENEEATAQEVLGRIRANLNLLDLYIENPPDEDAWDRALDEYFELAGEPLRIAGDLLEKGSENRQLLVQLIRAQQAHSRTSPLLQRVNDAQYGHRHRDAG